ERAKPHGPVAPGIHVRRPAPPGARLPLAPGSPWRPASPGARLALAPGAPSGHLGLLAALGHRAPPPVAALGGVEEEPAAALAGAAQVRRRAQRVARVRMPPLFRRVDEVERDVAGDERELLNRLDGVQRTSKNMFASTMFRQS